MTPDVIGSGGDRDWARDADLADDETLTPQSYAGAPDALHIDRGHQAPLGSFGGTPFAPETNILSNITPQSSALNHGPWVRLEDQERALAQRLHTAVYIYTGLLFERMMKPLPQGPALHRVPSGYWKVVALADGRVSAFIFDQTAKRGDDLCAARVRLQEVELRSRLLLFPMANAAKFTSLDSQLGCMGVLPPAAAPDEIPAEIPAEPPTQTPGARPAPSLAVRPGSDPSHDPTP